MCGRFTLTLEASVLQQELDLDYIPVEWKPRFNIAPSQNSLAIKKSDEKKAEWLRWGLIPFWAKEERIGNQMINARAETIDKKPSFRKSFQSKRCLILADGFFEWKRKDEKSFWKVAYYFKQKNDELFVFAGIWDSWYSPDNHLVESCAIITCQANECVGEIHDRMPVILDQDKRKSWLQTIPLPDLKSIMAPYPSEDMKVHPVSKQVNNTKNDYPEVIKMETISTLFPE